MLTKDTKHHENRGYSAQYRQLKMCHQVGSKLGTSLPWAYTASSCLTHFTVYEYNPIIWQTKF